AADAALPARQAVYASLAELLGAQPDEIALFDSATRAWLTVVHSLPVTAETRLVTGRAEYGSNAIALLQLAERRGCEIVLVEDDPRGQIDLEALARVLDGPPAVVSLTHVPTQSGLVNPAEEVGRLCREAGATF